MTDTSGLTIIASLSAPPPIRPTHDTVKVTVVPELHPTTRAVIDGPSEPVVVGVVTLDASSSSDPDGDAATYRWQTDEVGGVLPAEWRRLSSRSVVYSRRVAVASDRPGTYYFILLVNDEKPVVPPHHRHRSAHGNAGESVTRDATAEQVAARQPSFNRRLRRGLTPLVVVPFVCCCSRPHAIGQKAEAGSQKAEVKEWHGVVPVSGLDSVPLLLACPGTRHSRHSVCPLLQDAAGRPNGARRH